MEFSSKRRAHCWNFKCTPDRRMARYLMIVAAFLCTASIVAFLYYVPALPLFAVALVLIGFTLVFLFGVQVGSDQENPPPSGTNYIGMDGAPGPNR